MSTIIVLFYHLQLLDFLESPVSSIVLDNKQKGDGDERLTDEIRQKSLWTMMFTDNVAICESREEGLERWRYALEIRTVSEIHIQEMGKYPAKT